MTCVSKCCPVWPAVHDAVTVGTNTVPSFEGKRCCYCWHQHSSFFWTHQDPVYQENKELSLGPSVHHVPSSQLLHLGERGGEKWKLALWGGSQDDLFGHCKILGGRERKCENILEKSLLVGIISVSSSRVATCPSAIVAVNQKKVGFCHPYNLNSYLFKSF